MTASTWLTTARCNGRGFPFLGRRSGQAASAAAPCYHARPPPAVARFRTIARWVGLGPARRAERGYAVRPL
jgi:hypothetical protein